MKEMKKSISAIAAARAAFQRHATEHGCSSVAVISQSPSPQSIPANPRLRKPPLP
jgi:hypothetical protein